MTVTPPLAHADGSTRLRALTADDLDAVVAIDAAHAGHARPAFFGRRLQRALQQPLSHLQIAAERDGQLAGFVLARVGGGEFGGAVVSVDVETIGVAKGAERHGVGRALHAELVALAQRKGAQVLQTQVAWRDVALLGYFARQGWALSDRVVLHRTTGRRPAVDERDHVEALGDAVRTLRASDVEAIVRMDRQRTGVDRGAFLRRKVDAALLDSAVASSLVAESDGIVVGFCLAHVDFGAHGRIGPEATLEALAVQSGFDGQGYARALLNQLLTNLAALHIDQVTTAVAWDAHAMAGFFAHLGFAPAQRLALSRDVAAAHS